MGRHFVGVIAGYFFFGLASAALFGASGVDPRLSPTFGIALLTILAGAIFAVAEWKTGSVWSQIVTIFVLAPSALIGGTIEERRSRSDSLPDRSS